MRTFPETSSLQQIIQVLIAEQWLFYTAIVFFSLSIGSFLNVVIYRLPVMMELEYRQDCREYLELDAPAGEELQKITLSSPASTCPHCGHRIRVWENIPVLSYLLLRGRCSACRTPISPQYPLVESITALLSVIIAWHFGVTWQTLAALVFTWVLIALTVIDLHRQLLPDSMTLPLLWSGILVSLFGLFGTLEDSVIGAMAGYLVLWSVFKLFLLVTGKAGMGYGDFKLLAAIGAWLGWQYLPQVILISSFIGAAVGILLVVTGNKAMSSRIPFGPYLAGAGWVALVWGPQIQRLWFSTLQ